MSARRPIQPPSEKPLSVSQGGDPSSIVSDTSPAVPRDVIYKLLGFTFAMVVVPIGSYFFTLKTVFNGNATYSGAFAAIMANVVLISYIIVAMREEDETKGPTGKIEVEGKKEQ